MRRALLAWLGGSSATAVPPVQAELLRAVLTKIPPGSLVTADQLRSIMGIWSTDLCGMPLKELSGSWDVALLETLGTARAANAKPSRNGKPQLPRFIVPAELQTWTDPRPPPLPSTTRFDELLPGSTTYLTNEPDACDDLLRECNFESAGHLGLDLEWTPTMVRGQQLAVSLLQLATRDHCLLIRVGEMRAMGVEALPPGLTRLLTTNPPLKVGRGIRDDVSIIRTQLGVEMYGGGGRGGGGGSGPQGNGGGIVELPLPKESLKSLARQYGSFPVPNDLTSPLTNWDARELSIDVLRYAAFDAIAAYDLYTRVPGTGVRLQTPPRRSSSSKAAATTNSKSHLSTMAGGGEAAAAPLGKRQKRRQRLRSEPETVDLTRGEETGEDDTRDQ